jgi:uncharacterized protein (TIGR03435 family)
VTLKWIGLALLATITLAQSTPKFDVTSVRPNKSPDPRKGLLQWLPSGRFIANDLPLKSVIAAAWSLPFRSPRLIAAPGVKMPDEVYDIEATPEKGAFPPGMPTEARMIKMRSMVQALLEDRFSLRVRQESKEQPVYALVVAKGGPKLEKSKFQEENCHDNGPRWITNPACHFLNGDRDTGIHAESVTIASVVSYLNNFTDRPLFDKTGLDGYYEVETEGWAPMTATADDSDRQTLFNVFEKLGLRMESQRAVIDTFVIEHVEKPNEN